MPTAAKCCRPTLYHWSSTSWVERMSSRPSFGSTMATVAVPLRSLSHSTPHREASGNWGGQTNRSEGVNWPSPSASGTERLGESCPGVKPLRSAGGPPTAGVRQVRGDRDWRQGAGRRVRAVGPGHRGHRKWPSDYYTRRPESGPYEAEWLTKQPSLLTIEVSFNALA